MNHSIDIRVYYEDTDDAGVVYYANYLKFAERARTEMLRSMGLENKSLKETKGIVFVVRHIEVDYLSSAKLDDVLRVETSLESLKNTHMIMRQSFFRRNDLLCDMKVNLVCISAEGFKPVRFPDDLKAGFQKFIKES